MWGLKPPQRAKKQPNRTNMNSLSISYWVHYHRTTTKGQDRLYIREFPTLERAAEYARTKMKDPRNERINTFLHQERGGVTYVDFIKLND